MSDRFTFVNDVRNGNTVQCAEIIWLAARGGIEGSFVERNAKAVI